MYRKIYAALLEANCLQYVTRSEHTIPNTSFRSVTHGLDGLWCDWVATCNGIKPAAPSSSQLWPAQIGSHLSGNLLFLSLINFSIVFFK